VLIGKLNLARWERWSIDERDSILRFLKVWFDNSLRADTVDGNDIDALLCGMARADIPLAPYLTDLATHPVALLAFYEANAHVIFKKGKLANGFWKEAPSAAQSVVEFLGTPGVRDLLDHANK
jgi:hypothetical protein